VYFWGFSCLLISGSNGSRQRQQREKVKWDEANTKMILNFQAGERGGWGWLGERQAGRVKFSSNAEN
jgi:hypothetical protein